MRTFIEKVINSLQKKTTKIYLILANIILVIFAIWFSNVGLLPFSNIGDFLFFVLLGLLFAIYRPGWAFVFFIGAIALENINLAPQSLGLAIRPYQLLGALIIIALIIRTVMKRLPLPAKEFFPKFKWYDALPIIFVLGGFLSSFSAINKTISLKQSVVALSFVALYFLARTYIQSLDDLKRIAPFFLSSAIVIALYGILQNIIFVHGGNSFEVMPGRPNATFTEPDWLGIFLVFLLAVVFAIIYYQDTKYEIRNTKYFLLVTGYWSSVTIVFISLILVTIGFLKIMLTNGLFKISQWNWKKFSQALINLAVAIIFSFVFIYAFHLTNFQIFNRAASVAGLQKITIACPSALGSEGYELNSGDTIFNIADLSQYGCWHINLEDVEKAKLNNWRIVEVFRPDPNINIRSNIYQKSWQQIKQQPILGIGWGSISKILGTDERPARIATQSVVGGGTALNASNIFLEVWLGAGLLGILSFIILLGYIFIRSAIMFLDRKIEDKTVAALVILGWAAIVIPNIFNSGIFLGFVWVYLAIAMGLLAENNKL